MTETWTIRWKDMSQTYLYGSKISYGESFAVIFDNPLMPSSAVMNSWFSKTNYYAQRLEPALPILEQDKTYQISINAETMGSGVAIMRLLFLDRYDSVIEERIIRETSGEFRYPAEAYSYRLDLINGGITKMVFHNITIRETDDEAEE